MATDAQAETTSPDVPETLESDFASPTPSAATPADRLSDAPESSQEQGGSEEAAAVTRSAELGGLHELTGAVDRMAARLAADQDVIGRMQSRIEALQGDQVRALLGPAVTELANLHAAIAESAARDYERLGFDRVRKEFDLLADRVESAIDVLGAVSIDARVGDAFDSRTHQAVKHVPTKDPALDKTLAAVVRQGFTFDPSSRPALHARVQVFGHDTRLDAPAPASSQDDLELPFPLEPNEEK